MNRYLLFQPPSLPLPTPSPSPTTSTDSVHSPIQSTGEGEAPEVVCSLPSQREEEDPEGAGGHHSLQEVQDVQCLGVQGDEGRI